MFPMALPESSLGAHTVPGCIVATKRLSARKVASLKAREKEYLEADGDGLFIRVRPNGTPKGNQVWLLVYSKLNCGCGKLLLGNVADHTIETARLWATTQRGMLDLGIDPQQAKRQKADEAEVKQTRTLGALLNAYVGQLRSQGKVSAGDVENIFKLHVPEQLKKQPAADIRKDDLVKPIRTLVEVGKGRTAAKLRSYLGAAFRRALEASDDPRASSDLLGFGLIINPVSAIKTLPEFTKAGQRALSHAELAEYIRQLETLPDSDTKDVLRLALWLGGQRITQLIWGVLGHDTFGKSTIILTDPKGKRTQPRRNVLPLSGRALEIVIARGNRLFDPASAAIVENRLDHASRTVAKISRNMLEGGTATESFKLSDIRRTVETHMAARGVSKDMRAQLQSHGLSGVQDRHYDRHDYMAEKQQVLAGWEVYLSGLLSPGNEM